MYPVYIPSKGRADDCQTSKWLSRYNISHTIVVERDDETAYQTNNSEADIWVLPDVNRGLAFSRTCIKKYSQSRGEARHWQIDDDILNLLVYKGEKKREVVDPNEGFAKMEEFTDRYINVGISGPMHDMFGYSIKKPFSINRQCPTCVLVNNNNDIYWRPNCPEDTDYSIQILSSGQCTILFHVFQFSTRPQGSVKGGLSDFQHNDGYIKNVRGLASYWPRIVKLSYRHNRPSVNVDQVWKMYASQKLIKKSSNLNEDT